jgi:hypothetical protein
MTSTFLAVVEAGRGGPGLQTHLPCTGAGGAAASSAGSQLVTAPHDGQPCGSESTHLVPEGQQVRELGQHTASAHGQQPRPDAENVDAQQVCVAGQRVWFVPGDLEQACGQGAASGSPPPPPPTRIPEVSPLWLGCVEFFVFIQQVLLPWLNDQAPHLPFGSLASGLLAHMSQQSPGPPGQGCGAGWIDSTPRERQKGRRAAERAAGGGAGGGRTDLAIGPEQVVARQIEPLDDRALRSGRCCAAARRGRGDQQHQRGDAGVQAAHGAVQQGVAAVRRNSAMTPRGWFSDSAKSEL